MPERSRYASAKNLAIVLGVVVVVGIILWLDIATGVWSDLVVLSGLAAGLVTFLLNATIIDKLIARSAARRWKSVNRLAVSEILHLVADERTSEIARGKIVPRLLPLASRDADPDVCIAQLEHLRDQVMYERSRLAETLSRWAQFLISSGDNETIMEHIGDITWQLDLVRDAALEAELQIDESSFDALNVQISICNDAIVALECELRDRLVEDTRLRMRDAR